MKEEQHPILKAEAPSLDLLKLSAQGILMKARISGYTRKDGAFVAEHDDKRPAAKPKPKSAKERHSDAEAADERAEQLSRLAFESGDGHADAEKALRHAAQLHLDAASGFSYPAVAHRYRSQELTAKADKHKKANGPVEAHGVKGMNSTPWRKTFPSRSHYQKWLEKNDVEVHGERYAEDDKPAPSPAVKPAIPFENVKVNDRAYLASHGGGAPAGIGDWAFFMGAQKGDVGTAHFFHGKFEDACRQAKKKASELGHRWVTVGP